MSSARGDSRHVDTTKIDYIQPDASYTAPETTRGAVASVELDRRLLYPLEIRTGRFTRLIIHSRCISLDGLFSLSRSHMGHKINRKRLAIFQL